MWSYNHTPDPDGDSLMHYGVRGMKWKKRLARGPNQANTASQIALERARRMRPGYKSSRPGRRANQTINTQTYDGSKTKLSYQAQLAGRKSVAKQQVKTKINRAKRAVNAESRAKYAIKTMDAAKAARKAANKKADKAMKNFKSAVNTQIKVAKQKRKNKAMAKKYVGTTQRKSNK